MNNELTTKRSLVLILVVATAVVFIGLVWLIATLEPWNLLSSAGPNSTEGSLLVDKNCTYPVYYWKEHTELYPAQIVIGNDVYQANEIATVLADTSEDTVNKLKVQLVGAFLNIASGADDRTIETTIFQAYGWLVTHPSGSILADSEQLTGAQLYNALEAYNLGLTVVSACPGVLPIVLSETPTPTGTPTLLINLTPNLTLTLTPSGTITLTGLFTAVSGTVTPSPTSGYPWLITITPTRTPSKTTAGSTPTRTYTPGRTNTPITPAPTPTNTTAAPTPTNTPEPPTPTKTPAPPTPTFTEPPPPSPTFTEPPPL
jgi:hypothetical protein